MQISRNAQAETIHRVFRLLASRYHPDNPETGDLAKFLQLKQAYEVLSVPEKRAEYNELYASQLLKPLHVFELREYFDGADGERNRRMGILCLLYHRRRLNPEEAGMSVLEMETLMAYPREHLMFTLWYLRQKGYIAFNEDSDYEITGEGTDQVEAQLPTDELMQRLLSAPKDTEPKPKPAPKDTKFRAAADILARR
jgi:curved DNA-binding protein CbpA